MRPLVILLALLSVNAQPTNGEAPPERIFLISLGQPNLSLLVNGEPAGETDATGMVQLRAAFMAGEPLRFTLATPGWKLDTQRTVPAEDPAIPVLLDLAADLRKPTPPPKPSPPPPTDPCRERRSFLCQQKLWSQLEGQVQARDCPEATATLERLVDEYPDVLSAAGSAATLANILLDCGFQTSESATVERAIELANAFDDGALWCDGPGSRVLARAYEALGELSAAAETARRAADRCDEARAPALEWEFYFHLKAKNRALAAGVIPRAPRRLALFLNAWLALGRQECPEEPVEIDLESGDLPCQGFPQSFCARQYGQILAACGQSREDMATAARYLRASLPLDPATWSALDREGRRVLQLLAVTEAEAGRYAEAASVYDLLASIEEPTLETRLSHAEALLLTADETSQRAALKRYEKIRPDLASQSAQARAVVLNNICVLRARLHEVVPRDQQSADLDALDLLLNELPQEFGRLRLTLRHSLLSLRIRFLEDEKGMNNEEKLAQLRELQASFATYKKDVQEQTTAGVLPTGDGFIEESGDRFAVALLHSEESP